MIKNYKLRLDNRIAYFPKFNIKANNYLFLWIK